MDIEWNRQAELQFDKAIAFIEKDPPANADKVKREILQKITALLTFPEIHTPDKYKNNNDGSFRAFEIHRYRISYRFKNNEVRILRIRHTKMNR